MAIMVRSMFRLLAAFALMLAFVQATVWADETEGDSAKAASHESGNTEAGGEEEHSGSTMELKKDLALWSLVTFLIFVFVLKKSAWGPLIEGLDKREANFRQHLAEAEAARVKAEQMLREHAQRLEAVEDEVKAIIEEARRDAERTKQDIVAAAQKEAQTTQDRAIHEIERARDQALKELFDTMAGQVASATEHVLGRALNGDDQNRLIDEALSQFSSRS